jgi:zinc/manganese transport system ATP-binding protein
MTAAKGSIRLSDVTVAYGRDPAVRHLSGAFPAGSMTAIVGPNGAGKTTLLKALVGDVPLASGVIDRGGFSAHAFGYLPQASEIDRSFPLNVADTVMLGVWRDAGAFRAFGDAAAERGRQALAAVGLEGFERREVGSLSAGQFQRVLFARLLLQDADVVLLDEPFAAVDARTVRDLLDIILRWHDEKRTVIAALHNLDLVREHFPETLLLAGEAVAWGATASVMTGANLARANSPAEQEPDATPAQTAPQRSAA